MQDSRYFIVVDFNYHTFLSAIDYSDDHELISICFHSYHHRRHHHGYHDYILIHLSSRCSSITFFAFIPVNIIKVKRNLSTSSINQSIFASLYLTFHPSISIYASIHLSIYLIIFLYMYSSILLSIFSSIYNFSCIYTSIYLLLSTYLTIISFS